MATTSEAAAMSLAAQLDALGVKCEVNGDSAGYEVFVVLSDDFVLCIAATPEADGYDWQILDRDGQQALAGTWSSTQPQAAASLTQALVRGLGGHLVR